MKAITIHQAKTHFSKLIQQAESGKEVIIARGKQPVAKLVPIGPPAAKRGMGWAQGESFWMSEDFDEPLEDFKDYM